MANVASMDAATTPPPGPGVWRHSNHCWELYPFFMAESIFSALCAGESFVEFVDCPVLGRKRKRAACDDTILGRTAATNRVDLAMMKEVDLSTGREVDISIMPAAISSINYTPTEDPVETGVWWRDDLAQWHCYLDVAIANIQKAWRRQEHYVILEKVFTTRYAHGVQYILDLIRMKQINPISGRQRPIRIVSNMSMPLEAESSTSAHRNLTAFSLGSGALQRLLSLPLLKAMAANMVLPPHKIETIDLNEHLKKDDNKEKAQVGANTYGEFLVAYETLMKTVPGCCGQLDRLRTYTPKADKEELCNTAILRHVFYRAPSSELKDILENGLQGHPDTRDDFAFSTAYYDFHHKSLESPTYALLLFLIIVPHCSKGRAAFLEAIRVAGIEHRLPIAVLTLRSQLPPQNGVNLQVGCSTTMTQVSQEIKIEVKPALLPTTQVSQEIKIEVKPTLLPCQLQDTMWLHFKLYCPYCPRNERLRSVGKRLVLVGNRPMDILDWLRELAEFTPDTQIRLYKEDCEMGMDIDLNSTYLENQLQNGNVVVFRDRFPIVL